MEMDKRNISFSPPDISDEEVKEVGEALLSGWITTGPRTRLFERRLAAYIDTGRTDIDCNTCDNEKSYSNRVACLSSATAAEELNLRILGIKPGDEVIVPAYTYTSTASAAYHCGAKVIFADIQKNGDSISHAPEMDYDKLSELITDKTKAIITVDLGGLVCDYEKLFSVIEDNRYKFTAIEPDGTELGAMSAKIQKSLGRAAIVADSAHALGASRQIGGKKLYCGAIADFTSFSFHAVKNLTTAEGGASSWKHFDGVDDAEIHHMYQLLSLHGQNKDAYAKSQAGAWEYDIIGPYYKANMTDIMAAIGLKQLDRYLEMIDKRQQIIDIYDKTCKELGISVLNHHTGTMDSSNHLYLTRIPGIDENRRNDIITKMAECGVNTNVHYKPLPMMTGYKAYGWDIKDFPNSYDYYKNEITLPLYSLLTSEDAEYVCKTLQMNL